MIVVDASALIAIAEYEPERDEFLDALERASSAIISIANAVETGLILIGRGALRDVASLNRWLAALAITVEVGSPDHSEVLGAYLRYGRNYHPARLNLADCFAYALAKRHNAPLLFKGADFAMTDIRSAIQPT